MKLQALYNFLDHHVFNISTTLSLFNIYKDIDNSIDLENGAAIRRENLRKYLRSFYRVPKILILGEAPGHRGCRFSGVPFTSEDQLCDCDFPINGRQSSRSLKPEKEQTATIFWNEMRNYHSEFIAWNCIPFHPHPERSQRENRTPTDAELILFKQILKDFCAIVNPHAVVAVGKRPAKALKLLRIDHKLIRHPSHGGAREFKAGIRAIFANL